MKCILVRTNGTSILIPPILVHSLQAAEPFFALCESLWGKPALWGDGEPETFVYFAQPYQDEDDLDVNETAITVEILDMGPGEHGPLWKDWMEQLAAWSLARLGLRLDRASQRSHQNTS